MKRLSYFIKQKFSLSSRIATKITLASISSFLLIASIVMATQYWLMRSQFLQEFHYQSEIFMNNLLPDHFPKNNTFPTNSEIFRPFDSNGNSLWDAIIVKKSDKIIKVNEHWYLHENSIDSLLEIPEKVATTFQVQEQFYFVYRQDFGDYAIFYTQFFADFWSYYSAFFSYSNPIFLIIVIVFIVVAFYFSRLIIKPISEQQNSLILYNKNLAHELKTPLSVIQSNLDMLELTKDEKFISSSREELLHITKIIDSLLFLAKPHIDQNEFCEVDIVPTIEKFLQKYSTLNIDFSFQEKKNIQLVEPQLFVTLLKNIIDNAKKYSLDKKLKIEIFPDRMVFQNPTQQKISKKEMKKIREVFYQIDNSRNSQWYGIGIPMIQKICGIFHWKLEMLEKHQIFFIKIYF